MCRPCRVGPPERAPPARDGGAPTAGSFDALGGPAIAQTRKYLDDADRLLAAGLTREEFFFRMLERYPERVNPYTVWLSARRLLSDATGAARSAG